MPDINVGVLEILRQVLDPLVDDLEALLGEDLVRLAAFGGVLLLVAVLLVYQETDLLAELQRFFVFEEHIFGLLVCVLCELEIKKFTSLHVGSPFSSN